MNTKRHSKTCELPAFSKEFECSWAGQRFCSRSCAAKNKGLVYKPRSEEARQNIKAAARREAAKKRESGEIKGFYTDQHYKYLTGMYDHPLASSVGVVAEHRAVMFEEIGWTPTLCQWGCGRLLTWTGVKKTGIRVDHLDADRRNNAIENLLVSCVGCNAQRGKHPEKFPSEPIPRRELARTA